MHVGTCGWFEDKTTKSNINQIVSLQEAEDHEERFGIDYDETADTSNQVTVPELASTLKALIEARLQDTVDPSLQSSCFGCDLYLRAKHEVQTVIGQFR